MAKAGALEVGHVRFRLIRDLARGELNQSELAARYGVSPSAMTQFVKRHAERIAEVATKVDEEFAGIVFAEKAARVAELSATAEQIAEMLADPDTSARAGVQYAEMINAQRASLRAIADELGQIPGKLNVQIGGQLDIRMNGVDLGELT